MTQGTVELNQECSLASIIDLRVSHADARSEMIFVDKNQKLTVLFIRDWTILRPKRNP
jgi:hypothetical protein